LAVAPASINDPFGLALQSGKHFSTIVACVLNLITEIGRSGIRRGAIFQMKRSLFVIVLFFCSSTALAADFYTALTAYSQGDFRTAFDEFKILAEEGEINSQFAIAIMYDEGQGVSQDHAQAAHWYRKAAAQGHRKAQYNLAFAYDKGEGVEQDSAEAIKWYRKAAAQGLPEAQFTLGVQYDEGINTTPDLAEAVKWYRLAAEQGHLDAQNNLGFMYAQGRGVPLDRVQAYAWLNMAAEGGNEAAKMNRVLIKDEMTPDELEEGNKLASEFAEKYPKK